MRVSRADLATLATTPKRATAKLSKGRRIGSRRPHVPATPRSEAEVSRAIVAYLATRGDVHVDRMNSRVVRMPGKGGRERLVRFGSAGMADFVGYAIRAFCLAEDNRYVTRPSMGSALSFACYLAIEVKAEGKKDQLRPAQRAFLARVRVSGGIAVVADCVQDVVEALR